MKVNFLFIAVIVLFFSISFSFIPTRQQKQHYITTFSRVSYEKAISNENHEASTSSLLLVKNSSKAPTIVSNTTGNYILPIEDRILVIGKNFGGSEEEVATNEVVFNIIGELPRERQAYLEYDLFGLEDFTCVSRSINEGISIGGKVVKLKYEWSHQVEKIRISELKKGLNIIRFHVPEQANFHYKIKNVRIRFGEKINNERKIILNLPSDTSHYGEYFYVSGYVQTNDETPYTLYANDIPVYVYNHHFDEVFDFSDNNDATVELKAVFEDGFVYATKIKFSKNKEYHYLFNDKWMVPIFRTRWEPLKENKLTFSGLTLFSEENSVKRGINITVLGLRNVDMPLLDPNMINVTAHYAGYRCLPHEILFDKPIEVCLAYDTALIPKGYGVEDVRTFGYNEQTKKWEMLEWERVDKENQQVISKTNHFTDFINAILKTPELPQTTGYTPTSIKEMKVADPVAHVNVIEPPKANNSGAATVSFPIIVPAGRQGLQPNLNLVYNSENTSGIPGNGWDMPIPKITVDTRWGVPRYSLTKETEEYLLNGEQLVELAIHNGDTERLPLVHMAPFRDRTNAGETFYAYRVEGAFHRIIRHGTAPSNYWWEVVDKNGTTYYYGKYHDDAHVNENCVLRDKNGNIAEWALAEVRDLYNNFVKYEYGWKGSNQVLTINQIKFVFPYKITYTGHFSTPGAYSIEFIPDLDTIVDNRISCRYGFIKKERLPIERILVKYNNEFIKGYYFKYTLGAYHKPLLCSIVEYTDTTTIDSLIMISSEKDCNELARCYWHGAKVHVFEYYNEQGLSFEPTPVTVLTNTEKQDTVFKIFTDSTIQSIGRSKGIL